jgi:DNA mismatch repair protein MutL
MPIRVLDNETIDKIAAGEVVERPASVVKELVENSIDAGATAITVEIKDGGISYIRVSDNGCGIPGSELRTAFLRHATSKIQSSEDLSGVRSLGFRGEALSSIAAVSILEVITKTESDLTGVRLTLEGAVESGFEEVGAPTGTTFFVRNLFFNTPVRKKFLKSATTEGGYVSDLMEHLALSHPEIAFQFTIGSQTRFHTSGNGDLKEVIYRIYGRELANAMVPISVDKGGLHIGGFLGKPEQVRSNRNFEIYFINGRFIRSDIVSKAIEEGFREYLMLHKFPVCFLMIETSPENVDVNVHPTKMDVRFSDGPGFFADLSSAIYDTLKANEMIPGHVLDKQSEIRKAEKESLEEARKGKNPEPFLYAPSKPRVEAVKTPEPEYIKDSDPFFFEEPAPSSVKSPEPVYKTKESEEFVFAETKPEEIVVKEKESEEFEFTEKVVETPMVTYHQQDFFDDKILSNDNQPKYRIIGEVFDTFWMIQYESKLMIIDQHAAHEKVNYERMMKRFRNKEILSQTLMPPVVVSLSSAEENVYKQNADAFASLGFEIENFGGSEYAIRGVPVDLYGHSEKELFLEVLDELADGNSRGSYLAIEEKIADMSCKASVKGGDRLSLAEVNALIDELLTLDNPYNCPHGRPTIIVMTKSELEKKFKRIVD